VSRKKKKSRISVRTAWVLFVAYIVVGMVVAILFLGPSETGTATATSPQDAAMSPWALFPLVALLWPIFLVIMIVRQLS
jgi:hypothetical protein